jgi:hypothetical protein
MLTYVSTIVSLCSTDRESIVIPDARNRAIASSNAARTSLASNAVK